MAGGFGAAGEGSLPRPGPPPRAPAETPGCTGTAAVSRRGEASGAAPSGRAPPAARRVTFVAALPAPWAGAHEGAPASGHTGGPAAATDRPPSRTGPAPAPPPPPPPPPPALLAPAGAGGAAPAARPAVATVDPLHAALRPLLLPHTAARDGITVHRVWGLRFHEEYYGIYVQVAHRGVIFEGHISVLHCAGCNQRLSPGLVRRMEARCRGLRGFTVPLAHMGMVLVWRAGHVHRGWCTVHTSTPLSHELWTVRGFLSNWIPGATSLENRDNFHVSFDHVSG